MEGQLDIARLLIEGGADKDIQDEVSLLLLMILLLL